MILSALRLHFGFHFDSLLGHPQNSKNLQNHCKLLPKWGSAPSRQSFFEGLDCGCVLMMIFLQIFVILCCFWAPILRPFGTIRCKKMSSEKMMQKVLKNGYAVHASNFVPGGGPLKQRNQTIRQPDIGPNTPQRA